MRTIVRASERPSRDHFVAFGTDVEVRKRGGIDLPDKPCVFPFQ
jgi:hypothetical protein